MKPKVYPVYFTQNSITTLAAVKLDSTILTTYSIDEVFITIENNDIRFRIDGGTPTSSVGHLAAENRELYFEDPESIRNFSCIGSGGTAILNVTYYSTTRV